MSDLPPGWAEERIGVLCRLINGRAFKPSDWTSDGVPIVRIQNLNNTEAKFNRFSGDTDARFRIDSGELLFAWSGTPGTSFGAHIWDRGPAILNQHIFRVRFDEATLHKTFLKYAINDRLDHLVGVAHGGAGLAHVTKPVFEATELRIPPLAEQKRIVAKVEELTARSRRAKEALDAVPPLLDQLRQSILAAAFRGDLTADWRTKNPNVEPADKLLARIRAERRNRWETAAAEENRTNAKYQGPSETVPDAARTPLPAGWVWVTAEDCAWDITVGHVGPMKHRYVPSGVPFLRSQNVRENRFSREGLLHIPDDFHVDLRKSALRPGDLVVVRSGAPGTACVIPSDMTVANCADLVICRLVPSMLSELLCFFVNSQHAKAQVLDAQVGVAQQHFNIGAMRQLIVPLMPLEEQRVLLVRIADAFRILSALQDVLEEAHSRFSDLEASILSKAFGGALVPQDPTDEPASVLLDRIRAARDSERGETSGSPRRSRKGDRVTEAPVKNNHEREVASNSPDSAEVSAKDLSEIEPAFLQDQVSAALQTLGPLDKEAAVRRVADHLRESGHVDFQRLRANGPLFAQILDAVESAVKAGRLDRPKRGHVRACKPDAATYTPDDWRHALVTSLGTDPVDRDDAIRAAAEWARDNLGLKFVRLREDGHIVEGLRSALNSAIRRGEVFRHDSRRILRAVTNEHGWTPRP